jgi:GDPmannose 4,6-dehydratase
MGKTALITGANGQDASYLAEFLLDIGYEAVHGTVRRNSVPESQTTRIEQIHKDGKIKLHYADLTDPISIENVVNQTKPDELYHLAAQSHVQVSFDLPKYTLDTNGGGTLAVLEAVRRFSPETRVYNASTSEMYGNCYNLGEDGGFQNEFTKMIPVSPYGCSKLYAHNLCSNYRNAYKMFICSGILFNHESPRRGINFVTNKVALEAVKIKLGLSDKLVLGNLKAKRDWGHAKDYVKGMWSMLQEDAPDDYVLATGQTRSVEDLVRLVFGILGLKWKDYIQTDKKYERPEELAFLCGDATKANKRLEWKPTISFETMIKEMIDYWFTVLQK